MNKKILLSAVPVFFVGVLTVVGAAPAVAETAKNVPPLAASSGQASTASDDPAALRKQAEALSPKDKTSPEPYLLIGRACFIEGRLGKAASSFDKAIKRDPHSADAYYWRGRVYEEKGRLDEAANEYQAALKASPGHPQAQAAWKKLSDRLTAADAK